jgi:hypothetical protein
MRALLLAVCLALVACSGDAEPPSRAAPPTTAAPVPDPACPNQEAVVTDVSLRTGNPASGDVDGDGAADTVSVHYDPQGEPGCQAFVVAESSETTIAGALETWRSEFGLPMPTLNALQDVDGRAGDEIVVNMGAGASTQFVGIMVAEDGVLRQVTADVPGQVAPGMFAFGGSVGHLDAVDCAPGGGVVASSALPHGDAYRVERTFYDLSGAELVREDREVERVRIEEIDRFPEYAASPFGSCR